MRGNSSVVGGLNATIDATQQWDYNGGQWQIIKENWNYVTFKVQNPLPSTTFPQWTALIAPYLADDQASLTVKLVSAAYPVGDILLLAMAVRLTLDRGRRDASFWMLTGGMLQNAIALSRAVHSRLPTVLRSRR